jgi:hypothetical protein
MLCIRPFQSNHQFLLNNIEWLGEYLITEVVLIINCIYYVDNLLD